MRALETLQKISKKLLQYFLNDGIVRGVDSDGRIYSHLTDPDLTQQFIKRIKNIKIAGFMIESL